MPRYNEAVKAGKTFDDRSQVHRDTIVSTTAQAMTLKKMITGWGKTAEALEFTSKTGNTKALKEELALQRRRQDQVDALRDLEGLTDEFRVFSKRMYDDARLARS